MSDEKDIRDGTIEAAGQGSHGGSQGSQGGQGGKQGGKAGEDEGNNDGNKDRTGGGNKNDDSQRKVHNSDPNKQSGKQGNR